MKTGTTFEVLRRLGNVPVSKDLLMSLEIGTEINTIKEFRYYPLNYIRCMNLSITTVYI